MRNFWFDITAPPSDQEEYCYWWMFMCLTQFSAAESLQAGRGGTQWWWVQRVKLGVALFRSAGLGREGGSMGWPTRQTRPRSGRRRSRTARPRTAARTRCCRRSGQRADWGRVAVACCFALRCSLPALDFCSAADYTTREGRTEMDEAKRGCGLNGSNNFQSQQRIFQLTKTK